MSKNKYIDTKTAFSENHYKCDTWTIVTAMLICNRYVLTTASRVVQTCDAQNDPANRTWFDPYPNFAYGVVIGQGQTLISSRSLLLCNDTYPSVDPSVICFR